MAPNFVAPHIVSVEYAISLGLVQWVYIALVCLFYIRVGPWGLWYRSKVALVFPDRTARTVGASWALSGPKLVLQLVAPHLRSIQLTAQ